MSALPSELVALADTVLEAARARSAMLAAAESCTGGLVAAALTEIAGASDVFDRGFATYSNAAKESMLGVPSVVLERFGAVSEQTARAMADGALARSNAAFAVSITGVAGPGGGSAAKPVGLVWFALAASGAPTQALERRFGDIGRSEVRVKSALQALELLARALA